MANISIANFPDIIESEYSALANIVAYVENKIIGCACISELSPFINFQTLQELFVHHQYICQGVGTKLLQTLEANSVSRGCQIIELYSSITAELFYQANGYQTVERIFIDGKSTSIPVVYIKKSYFNLQI